MEVHNVIFNGKYNAENIDKLATSLPLLLHGISHDSPNVNFMFQLQESNHLLLYILKS